jgi:hypothetical protein
MAGRTEFNVLQRCFDSRAARAAVFFIHATSSDPFRKSAARPRAALRLSPRFRGGSGVHYLTTGVRQIRQIATIRGTRAISALRVWLHSAKRARRGRGSRALFDASIA